jgi:predicted ATPase
LENESVQKVRPYYTNPISFDLRSRLDNRINVRYSMEITDGPGSNNLFIKQETLSQKGRNAPSFDFIRDALGRVTGKYIVDEEETVDAMLLDGISLLNLSGSRLSYDVPLRNYIQNWQFVSLIPQNMGYERSQSRATNRIKLEKGGSNIAEYLLDIRRLDPLAFEGIVNTLQLVLPYSQDLQVAITSELDRSVYLQLTEKNFKVPGWLLSTGTLRILALLALLRHPEPPPLIIIEEIENGLDPSSVHLIVNEIREAVEGGKTQVILTTHSPYLLDLLLLDHIVLVERVEGQPVFSRPGDNKQLQQWAQRFGPGTLYTTSRLSGNGSL